MHEELKAQYAEDAAVHPRPWELWFTVKKFRSGWWQCGSADMAFSNCDYRRHKHADLMIEAHLHPEYEWEELSLSGLWLEVNNYPMWSEKTEYRRKNKHQELLDAVAAGKADEWEVHYKRWATGDWGSGGNEAHVWEIERHQNDWETRRKPQTITVNGREVPAPCRGRLDIGMVYFVASPTAPEYVVPAFTGVHMCAEWLSRGVLHLTKEAAVAHAKAMLNID